MSGLTHYDPYGSPRPGSSASTGIGYAGEYRDATGLVNLRARAYDPVLGRFIGRDTFGGVASAPQTANRYAYALANPLRYTDPSGHFVNNVLLNPRAWYTIMMVSISIAFPVVGIGLGLASGISGVDMFTGESLSPEARALYIGGSLLAGGIAVVGWLRALPAAGETLTLAEQAFRAERLAVNGALRAESRLAEGAGTLLDDVLVEGGVIERAAVGGDAVFDAGFDDVARYADDLAGAGDAQAQALGTGLKRGPKPAGTGPHNLKIKEVADSVTGGRIIAGGQQKPEVLLSTPGGLRSGRRPDILVQRPDGSLYGINVGLQSPRTGAPITREVQALNDLEWFGGLEMYFVPYN